MRLCRAILGLNVRYDLDFEPATRSVSSLPGNVCVTRSDGLLIGYKVACQFDSHPVRQAVLLSGSSPKRAAGKPGFAALIPARRYTRDGELFHNKHGALNAARTGERNDLRDIALDQRAKLVVDLEKSGGVDR